MIGRREEGSGWGTCVYLWRIHVDIWQNQYNIVKLRNKKKIKKKSRKEKKIHMIVFCFVFLLLNLFGFFLFVLFLKPLSKGRGGKKQKQTPRRQNWEALKLLYLTSPSLTTKDASKDTRTLEQSKTVLDLVLEMDPLFSRALSIINKFY